MGCPWRRVLATLPPLRDLPTPLPGQGPAPGPGPGPDRDLGPGAPRFHPPHPPSRCVPMATAPLRATFKGEVYTHAHAPSRRQLRIPQPFHQRGRTPTTGFLADCEVSAPPRRPAAGPRPASRPPVPDPCRAPWCPFPGASPSWGGPSRPPLAAPGPPGRALFRALAPRAGAALPGREAILGRAARAAAAPGLPGRVRARDRGHAGAGLPSLPTAPPSSQAAPSSLLYFGQTQVLP